MDERCYEYEKMKIDKYKLHCTNFISNWKIIWGNTRNKKG